MAKKQDQTRTFNVAVIGLSGTEKEKGKFGIGKSCLCNRFMRPLADDYYTEHISVLSQSDFGGRVVNNDHFLYWGETSKTTDDGQDFNFHVIEQTDFLDDTSFQSFKIGKTEPYLKRCVATKVQSAEKLMYICKNQLGLESELDQKFLPDGKLTIDGFLCLFDVSVDSQRPIERQVEFTAHILANAMKTRKPIVLVTTKNDQGQEVYIKEAERLVSRKEFKNAIPIVETSAHEGINVELSFLTLAHLIDRTKGRPKIVPYFEAATARKEVLDVARDAYLHLLRGHVTDYKALWAPTFRRICNDSDYNHYVESFGTDEAKKLFGVHRKQLKEERVQHRTEIYLQELRDILHEILPDLGTIQDRSWPNILRWLRKRDFFDEFFVEVAEEGFRWYQTEFLENTEETRIPWDLLDTKEADKLFRDHVSALRVEYKRQEMRHQFKQLLGENHNVRPGKSLGEVAIFFLGRECFSMLSEDDKQSVYEQHQKELREVTKRDFLELLLEYASEFIKFDPQREITKEDVRDLEDKLHNEPRYKALNGIEEDRRFILLNYLGFLQNRQKAMCPFKDHCCEILIDEVLSKKARRPQSWSKNSCFTLDAEDNKLNLVLLGNCGLAEQLAVEIRLQCIDDEFTLDDGQIYSLDYRPIDSDVTLPHNSFRTRDFVPHGCFCVYNSEESFEYIRESLEQTLLSDLQTEDRLPFQGLPIVIVLAHALAISDKTLEKLRHEGQQLADRLQCPFVDIPSSLMVDEEKKFHAAQIGLAMHSLVQCIKHRSSFVTPWDMAESIEPDIRILMCFMCGDDFNVELPLAPMLNHQFCYVTTDEYPTITLETYLDESKRKVEVTVLSYHGANLVINDLYHGFILVFSAKRRASLSTLSAFASIIPPIPTKILAVTESGASQAFFSNDGLSQHLITEGNAIADRLGASFMTTCTNFHIQTASYTPFFKEAWDKKLDTESAFSFHSDDDMISQKEDFLEKLARRPPARLPTKFETFHPTMREPENSEPIYDRPYQGHYASDSERGSSVSPTPEETLYSEIGNGSVYSEIPADTEHLIKSSQPNKPKRFFYTEQYRRSFPNVSLSEESATLTSPPKHEPHYQFRKSNSMKLALKEGWEGLSAKDPPLPSGPRKLHKSTTLPHPQFTCSTKATQDSGWFDNNVDNVRTEVSWGENIGYEPLDKEARPRPPPPIKPKPLDPNKFHGVQSVLSRNFGHFGGRPPAGAQHRAPLATPEQIEIGDYAQVKDALFPVENDYASVADALPAGQVRRIRSTVPRSKQSKDTGGSDSDSDLSSMEKENRVNEDIYARVNRRPTPHKKKQKGRSQEGLVPFPPPRVPTLPPYTEDRHHLLDDRLDKVMTNSASEGSEGTGDEIQAKSRKKRRSFRGKKKKSDVSEQPLLSPPWSDTDCKNTEDSFDPREYRREVSSPGRYVDEVDELDDSGNWRRKFRLTSQRDKEAEKLKKERKEEKKKLKDEEKKVKEQQKNMKKFKKKDGKKPLGAACAGLCLQDLIQSEENLIPLFVEHCVQFIEEEGMQWEGLYRVPGNKAQVEIILEKYEKEPNTDMTALVKELDIPVSAVATSLKSFFSQLNEPILPTYLHAELLEAISVPEKSHRNVLLRGLLKKLPQVNFAVLKYLITHIYRVSQYSSVNNMDVKNLVICWWPTLLRPEFSSFETMNLNSELLQQIILSLVEQNGFFFYGEHEV